MSEVFKGAGLTFGLVLIGLGVLAGYSNYQAGTLQKSDHIMAVVGVLSTGVWLIMKSSGFSILDWFKSSSNGVKPVVVTPAPAVNTTHPSVVELMEELRRTFNLPAPSKPAPPPPAPKLVQDTSGQYVLEDTQQRDTDAIHHLASRADMPGTPKEIQVAILKNCQELLTLFFNLNHYHAGLVNKEATNDSKPA